MGAPFKMLPLGAKLALGAALIAIVVGGYLAWAHHQREIGRLEIVAKDAKALADQKEKDAALSARLVNEREDRIRALEATANQVREVIRYVPVTTSCGPAVGNAADFVRDALSQTGGPPAGRQPASVVRTAPAPAR